MKIKKPKKIRISFSARYLYILAWLMMIGTCTYLGFFLYENFYQTVAQTDEIILLKKEVAPDIIDTEKIDKVLHLINEKTTATSTIDYDAASNPFSSKNRVEASQDIEDTFE